jgi:hypothetical protein
MKVRMKKTVDGAPDGTLVKTFVEGSEHDLTHTARSRDLAQVFVREGWAVEVGTAAEAEAVRRVEETRALNQRLDASIAAEKAELEAAKPAETTAPAPPKGEKRKGK